MILAGRRRRDACAVALLSLLVVAIGRVWGSRVAAGADAYGYISQADLWLHGTLHVDQPFAARVPWPFARWTFAPLGYRPAPDGFAIVPQYPPGLPLLMAGATLIAGQCALFWVVPIGGGVLVAATYAIARRLVGDSGAVGAAWIVATSPTVLFMTIAPMSDVPAAAAWAVAIACVLGETSASAFAGGVAAAAAILIRPNLAPLAVVMAVWTARRHRAAALIFAVPAALGMLAVAAIDSRLYGSPFKTGYDLTDAFSASYVAANVQHYVGWLVSAETPLACAGLIALALPWPLWQTDSARRARSLCAGCAGVVWLIYLFYVPWDAWWYLRFLLPTWPMMAAGTVAIVAAASRLIPRPWLQRAFAASVVLAIGVSGVWQARRRDTFNAARGETKYVEVARAVEAIADPDAVIISAQHSGSIRYYAGRLTVRWDVGAGGWLDRIVDWLAANGHHPYLVLEPQEIAELRTRFGASNAVARLDWTPLVVFRHGGVTLYDGLRRERAGATVEQPELRGMDECATARPSPQLR